MIRAAFNPPMWLDHEKTRMLREADAMTFDPTTNRVPLGLLKPEEQAALKAWPHGWQAWCGCLGWIEQKNSWVGEIVYRGKPAPPEPRRYVLHWRPGTTVQTVPLSGDSYRLIITEHPDGTMTAEVEAL